MKALQDIRIFIETARLGSLSAAARALDLSPAVTSAAIKRLEQELGQALFVRSTRQLRMTQHGERFLASSQPALELLDDGCAAMRNADNRLSGMIAISAPSDFGRNLLCGWLTEFMQQHPQVTLRLHLSDSLTDTYQQPVDLMVRYGEPASSNLIALPLSHANRRILCASPEYLGRVDEITHPNQLSQHNCLSFALDDATFSHWQLWHGQQSVSVKVSGDRIANDGELVHRWALAGNGIAFKSLLDISADIANGRLVQICPPWQSQVVPLNLLCASRNQLTPTVRALQQFLQEKIEQQLPTEKG